MVIFSQKKILTKENKLIDQELVGRISNLDCTFGCAFYLHCWESNLGAFCSLEEFLLV